MFFDLCRSLFKNIYNFYTNTEWLEGIREEATNTKWLEGITEEAANIQQIFEKMAQNPIKFITFLNVNTTLH